MTTDLLSSQQQLCTLDNGMADPPSRSRRTCAQTWRPRIAIAAGGCGAQMVLRPTALLRLVDGDPVPVVVVAA